MYIQSCEIFNVDCTLGELKIFNKRPKPGFVERDIPPVGKDSLGIISINKNLYS